MSEHDDREQRQETVKDERASLDRNIERGIPRSVEDDVERFANAVTKLRTQKPEQFVAVEREAQRLRGVPELMSAEVCEKQLSEHAERIDSCGDEETKRRLLVRALALSTLHKEAVARAVVAQVERIGGASAWRDISLGGLSRGPETAPADRDDKPMVSQAPVGTRTNPASARPLPVYTQSSRGAQSGPSGSAPRVVRLPAQNEPAVLVRDEMSTEPCVSRASAPSDVFQPMGASVRDDLITEPSRPNASRALASEVSPTAQTVGAVDRVLERETETVTFEAVPARVSLGEARGLRDIVVDGTHQRDDCEERSTRPEGKKERFDRSVLFDDAKRSRDNDRETELVRLVYRSERLFLETRMDEPERAERIMARASTLRFGPDLSTRKQALLAHEACGLPPLFPQSEKHVRVREDVRMALAIVARERDDEHYQSCRAMKASIAGQARKTEGEERDALKTSLRTFLAADASLDAQFLRREMVEAASRPGGKQDAQVLALTLDTHPHRPLAHHGGTSVAEASASRRPPLSIEESRALKAELVELRVQQAFGELSSVGEARAKTLALDLRSSEKRERSGSGPIRKAFTDDGVTATRSVA